MQGKVAGVPETSHYRVNPALKDGAQLPPVDTTNTMLFSQLLRSSVHCNKKSFKRILVIFLIV